ncbi:hypothetical protein [Kribbella sancticallisti]
MASRLIRSTGIAAGIAAVAGLGIGYAAGDPVRPTDIVQPRKLPADLCDRLGDVSLLLPKATNLPWQRTGNTEVVCSVGVRSQAQPTFTAAALKVRITPYGGRAAGAGQPPFTPAEMAKQAYDRKPWEVLPDRPYPTRIAKSTEAGGQSWRVSVMVVRADLVVQVDYEAHPITEAAAQQGALVLADRAIWEAK